MKERLLIIENDELLARVLRLHFEKQGYETLLATSATDGIEAVRNRHPEVVILDAETPSMDGWNTCHRVKEAAVVPVLVLTGRGDTTDAACGCEAGADDCLRKPFSLAELDARVAALTKQAGIHARHGNLVLSRGDLQLDLRRHRTTLRGEAIALTPAEFRLLAYMMQNRGKLLTHDDLLARVWGSQFLGEHRYLGLCVRYLRHKLRDDSTSPEYIASVTGEGYRFL